ncbi:MAG: HAD-IIIA family hydrolase [Bacteroidota bacterium]
MAHSIEAILFDMGGTLRGSVPTSLATQVEKVRQILRMLDSGQSAAALNDLLTQRFKAYMRWARETLIELDEVSLWTEWMLPDWPAGRIAEISRELNELWRQATGIRELFPETKEVVIELFRRGYRLGIVSNTTSSVEVPRTLRALELAGCFETVILSCEVGIRKPDPAILLEAARRMEVPPERCAYIGDRLDRDVQSAQRAGFAKVVIHRYAQDFPRHQSHHPDLIADHYVDDLRQLLAIFPAMPDKREMKPLFNASLSTMWARRNFPRLSDFFEAAGRLGFPRVELNHQVDSAMLDGTKLSSQTVSSIHEPCPADISTEELKERDWLVSSPDEDCRRRGVEAVRRTVDLARRLKLAVMVVHCGWVSGDISWEKKLRSLLEAGQSGSPEYLAVQRDMRARRAELIAPRLEAVKRSLIELLECASGSGLRLGLENRYHFFDIPSPDEMGDLLALAGPDRLGFVYDVGHAQTLDRLGFYPHEGWLRRFGSRIIETHLHDVIGVSDHLAPGLGEVDFDMVARYLPAEAVRALELQPSNTPGQVRDGLRYLAAHGCIRPATEVPS